MVEHLEKQFVLTVLRQYLEKITVSHVASGQAGAVVLDILDEMAQNSIFVRADTEKQR